MKLREAIVGVVMKRSGECLVVCWGGRRWGELEKGEGSGFGGGNQKGRRDNNRVMIGTCAAVGHLWPSFSRPEIFLTDLGHISNWRWVVLDGAANGVRLEFGELPARRGLAGESGVVGVERVR